VAHLLSMIAATGGFAVSLALRTPDPGPAAASAGAMVVSTLALLVLSVGGFLGGRLAYHYGVRVADECTQAEGFVADLGRGHHAPGRYPASPPRRPRR
jgi:hypothetical protein